MNELAPRFARHQLVPGWRQSSLADATVVIVGVGALGNAVAQQLALSGVGRLVLCDPDHVAESNLSRAPLFLPRHQGVLKVDAAAETLRGLVADMALDLRPMPLVSGVGLAELRDASLVIGCLDSRAARLQLAGRCNLVRAASIDLATSSWGGEVRLYLDSDGACYGCDLTPAERGVVDSPWSCLGPLPEREVGATATVSSLIASWGCLFGLRRLMGSPVPNQTLVVDGERGESRWVTSQRDPDCPLHEPLQVERTIELSEAACVGDLLDALGPDSSPLLWQPVMVQVTCPRCGWNEPRFGSPRADACPQCQKTLRLATQCSLAKVPRELSLAAAQIAPREILPVRYADGIRCVELL